MLRIVCILLLLGTHVHAQLGDKKDGAGEQQQDRVPAEKIPPAPALNPEDALKSFKLQPGFKIEVVASEPLVQDPVALAFDGNGRCWVVEMTGYMRDFDASDEREPLGSVVVLEDTDKDGKMDKRTVFLDKLTMPRALSLVRGGVLIAEPPMLWFCRDTNGDLKCDQKLEVMNDYGDTRNPEHTANGLLWALDNWIYNANLTVRLQSFQDDRWRRESTTFRGQWGISQDDYGRLVYNSNSDQFRMDLVPAHYLQRNPNLRNAAGLNVDPIKNQTTWPIRVTPGVNRGYRDGVLREDGTLARFTAACGPLIYRGNNFPPEFYGNAFVCEPSANLIKRNILAETNGEMKGWHAYENSEFLASTDERFRPVNLYNGLDGALYVVDLYRGVIQHKIYLTSYLRRQSESRNLQQPIGFGRIYRIVYDKNQLAPITPFENAPGAELVARLSDPNGAVRDIAQRLLVERKGAGSIDALKDLAVKGKNHLARLHALWTLHGIDALDAETILTGLEDPHAKVKAAAIRLCENFFDSAEEDRLLTALLRHVKDRRHEIQFQLALTFGQSKRPKAELGLTAVARNASENVCIRDGIVSGLKEREVEFLGKLLSDPGFAAKDNGKAALLSRLSETAFLEGKPDRIEKLLAMAAEAQVWHRESILGGIASTAPIAASNKPAPKTKALHLEGEPAGLKKLLGAEEQTTKALLRKVEPLLSWPGKAGVSPEETVRPLTAQEQKRFEAGKELYLISCNACHQPTGMGMEGLAPPLAGSEWTQGSDGRLIRIILHGLKGPLTVKGRKWELEMPGLPFFDDDQIASILTYVRREWQNTGDPVSPQTVKQIRQETVGRAESWSESELLKIP